MRVQRLPAILRVMLAATFALALWALWAWAAALGRDHPVAVLALKASTGDTNSLAMIRQEGRTGISELEGLLRYRDPMWRRLGWSITGILPRRASLFFFNGRLGPLDAAAYRAAGAKTLGLLGPAAKTAVPSLLEALQDPESYIALEAAGALAKIGEISTPGLIDALSHRSGSVRHAACYGLGELGAAAEPAVPNLILALNDPDPAVRSSSAYSLTSIGYPSLTALSNLIDHADANARTAAVAEFIRLNRSLRSMVRPLIKMAHSDVPSSRREAIEALGTLRTGDDASLRAFTEALHDSVPDVKLAALKCLGQIPWRLGATVNDLTVCLDDTSSGAREEAARLLGTIGPPARSSLPSLEKHLQDVSPPVRSAAREALSKIRPPTELDRPAQ